MREFENLGFPNNLKFVLGYCQVRNDYQHLTSENLAECKSNIDYLLNGADSCIEQRYSKEMAVLKEMKEYLGG